MLSAATNDCLINNHQFLSSQSYSTSKNLGVTFSFLMNFDCKQVMNESIRTLKASKVNRVVQSAHISFSISVLPRFFLCPAEIMVVSKSKTMCAYR